MLSDLFMFHLALNRGSLSLIVCLLGLVFALPARGQALPINIQGRVTTNSVAFNGTGKFKFAIVRANGAAVLWTHDGTSAPPNFEPTSSISLTVTRGLYSVLLGDPTFPGMTNPIDPDIFANPDVRLRIWFDDGVNNFQRLIPDQRMGAVGFAMNSARADIAATLTGSVSIDQVPATLVTNNATAVTLTGAFTGDGSGLIGIRGSTPWQIAASGTNDAFPNTGYLVTNLERTVIRLPETASMRVGDIIRAAGPGGGSWQIGQRAGQSIFSGRFTGGVASKWVAKETARSWTGIAASADGTRLFAAPYNNGLIFYSTDSGMTWTNPSPSPQKKWRGFACSADGQRVLAAAEDNTLTISTDGGVSWSARANAGSAKWWSVASSVDGTNLVAVAFGGALSLSADGGNVWNASAAAGFPRNWVSVACSSDGTNLIAAVNGERLYGSKDKGASWGPLNSAGVKQWTFVASSADGQRLVATANGAAIVTSVDGGATWVTRTSSGAFPWIGVTSSADGSKLAAVAAVGKIYNSLDGGATWTEHLGDATWYGVASSADGTKLFATLNGGQIYVSLAPPIKFTTVGPTGYLVGDEFSSIELQHIGDGKFMPLTYAGTIFAY